MAESSSAFIKKLIGFSVVTWISFGLSFLTAPISTRLFIPEVLGKINIFNTYSNLFGILIMFGLDQAFARFYLERPNNRSKGYLFTFCFGTTYSLLLFFIVLSIPFGKVLSLVLFEEGDNLLLILFFFSVFCTSTLRYLNLSYRMEKNIKMYTIQGILITLVSKVLYLGVGFWDPSYKLALIVLTISHVVLAVIFLGIQRNRFEFISVYDKGFTSEMLKFAIPLIPVSVLMWANTSIPQIIMQKTMDYHSMGIFTSAVALANVILVVQSGFNTFWVPYTYENYKTQTGQFYKIHKYLIFVLTLCALILVLCQDVVFLLLGEKYREAKVFFPFLILGPVSYMIGETTGLGINISKRSYLNIIVFGISVIFNIVLCLLLGALFGIPGIAISTAFAAIVAMILKTYFGEKYYVVIQSYKYMFFSASFILVSALITWKIPTMNIRISLLVILFLAFMAFFRKEVIELSKYALKFIRK
ncbi:lipopolysaccharide biosynthesis protein [Bacteroides heparinolyticus]|uniref:lipopolysaccharide biosynthesis protein n=1 Tax=Prevotella heparinolytica TaxID=28113 RepID=UPI0023F7C5ED|nr:oligosaccharide flippase family protein [Bacteroides heparinolyticus]MCI6213149.1 oligosaccharide flippase family protein [Bacteroides heparinolyticus]